ncbi:hypothetical protein LJC59_00310 [Desulfovibrio sp. OttesenSCG-928-A18]|nr:hypothetical protein [Desulfovibrio sp. OttesenSCG-928-A18]
MSQADIARPSDPASILESNVYSACKAFVLAYALPAMSPHCVIEGWQNRTSLPADVNEYAVISILHDKQHGTAVEEYTWDSSSPDEVGRLEVKGLIELAVQVDFCAENDSARQRARRLAIITRSSIGAQFFNECGMSSLYADDARDISFTGDARQFVRRWTTTLHLTLDQGISANFEAFDKALISRLEDVDAHHKA